MFPSINIAPNFSIPTYYVILSLAACVGILWAVQRSNKTNLSRKVTLDLCLIIMAAGFIGGRLFHIFYEELPYYQEDWSRALQFWNGGFVFYGGALLAGFSSAWYLIIKDRKNLTRYFDLFSPVLSLTYILGRGACFLAGCCYGRSCDLPWAVAGKHPTQIYASMWELGVLFILLGFEKSSPRAGRVFYLWLILHAIGRILMEAFRDDFRGPTWGLSISTWISIILITIGLALFVKKDRN